MILQTPTLGLILMTLATLQFGIIPLFADINKTHATHPQWPAHARFHVVTQVITTTLIACIALWLMWSQKIDHQLGVCIATALGLTIIGGFLLSAAFRKLYGGALSDDQGGIAKIKKIDANLINFVSSGILLVIGRAL